MKRLTTLVTSIACYKDSFTLFTFYVKHKLSILTYNKYSR
jgi:hypothetical protein